MAKYDHEFVYSAADFSRVRLMLHDHCEIALGESKRSVVYNRLARRLRARGQTRFDEYLDLAQSDAAEWTAFLDALTTNPTAFFREPQHFEILSDYVKRRHLPRLRIWCTASATGEEPYSIAITMIEAYNSDKPPVEIIASDVDTDVLEHAQRGVYADERLAPISERRQRRFFQRGDGPNAGFARVDPALRTMIDYRRINLQDSEWPVPGDLDIIFCRNVLVYFEEHAQRQILRRFGSLIAQDGLLVTGASEKIAYASDLFTSLGQTAYRPNVGSRLVASNRAAR